nr:tetratricopeptide repeat protein [Nocardioides thalensis]
MVALVAAPEEQVAIAEAALALARSNTDPRARDWDASLLNNVGMTHADAEDWPAALAAFEEALAARERIGDDGRTRVARWMVAWALRNLGRNDEAFEMQTALKAELEAIGEEDPYVDEELEILRSGGSTGR